MTHTTVLALVRVRVNLGSHDYDVLYLFLQKQKIGAKLIYTLEKVRTIRSCLEGLALMI